MLPATFAGVTNTCLSNSNFVRHFTIHAHDMRGVPELMDDVFVQCSRFALIMFVPFYASSVVLNQGNAPHQGDVSRFQGGRESLCVLQHGKFDQ